jgi:hypothetical protein
MLYDGSTSYVSSSATRWGSCMRIRLCYMLVLLHTLPVVLHVGSTLYAFGDAIFWVYFTHFQSHYISFLLYIVPLTIYFLSTSCRLRHATCSGSTVFLDLLILIMLVNSANFEASHYAIFQFMLLIFCYSQAASSLTRSSLVVRNQVSQT